MEKRRKRDDGEVDGNINSVQTSEDPLLSALGRDILTNVLQKLPPESLIFRCKLVSKTWQSLISDPAFVDGYCRMHHHLRSSGFIQQEIDAKRNNKNHPKGEVLQFIAFDNDGADAASTVITGRLGSSKNVRESDVLFVDAHKDVLLCIQCKELTLSNILKAQRYFLINPHSQTLHPSELKMLLLVGLQN